MPLDPQQVKENLRNAILLAGSSTPADHTRLLGMLNSKAFLFSVEEEERYLTELPKKLRVARVIKNLMISRYAIAHETLVKLIGAQEFLSVETLSDLLIIALVVVRPLPPVAVAFLDAKSAPDNAGQHLVMITLAANESEPALLLFERKIADPNHDVESRTIWLRVEYLVRRNDVPILRSYKRMIVQGSVPAEMRPIALESLCCYDPRWYLACTKPEPPLRLFASPEAKSILREILTHAKNSMNLSTELRLAVEATTLEIGGERR
jgi:hypothetical protein